MILYSDAAPTILEQRARLRLPQKPCSHCSGTMFEHDVTKYSPEWEMTVTQFICGKCGAADPRIYHRGVIHYLEWILSGSSRPEWFDHKIFEQVKRGHLGRDIDFHFPVCMDIDSPMYGQPDLSSREYRLAVEEAIRFVRDKYSKYQIDPMME